MENKVFSGNFSEIISDKKYQIIYADPPWHFSSKELQTYNGVRFTSMDKHYETQKKDWIKKTSS